MKTLTLANQKGGVGKSAVAVQLAYYLADVLEKRVLVIDFDHQKNTTKALTVGGFAHVEPFGSSKILRTKIEAVADQPFVLIPGDGDLIKMERAQAEHNQFATNLYQFINSQADRFDVCIIDTNPNPDIRQLASLVVSDFVLSPIQLNQEAIDGIGDLLNHENIGIRKIKATINKKLELIGILPNLVEPTPFQKENLRDLAKAYSGLMIQMDKGVASIKRTTAIPEAQAAGLPLWKVSKTSAREAYMRIKPVFDRIVEIMEV